MKRLHTYLKWKIVRRFEALSTKGIKYEIQSRIEERRKNQWKISLGNLIKRKETRFKKVIKNIKTSSTPS